MMCVARLALWFQAAYSHFDAVKPYMKYYNQVWKAEKKKEQEVPFVRKANDYFLHIWGTASVVILEGLTGRCL